MKINDIHKMWKSDCEIDKTDLANESIKTAKLHSKYLELYSQEKLLLVQAKNTYDKLEKLKFDYYTGKLSEEELEELGWEQIDKALSKGLQKDEIKVCIKGDEHIQNSLLKLSLQQQKVDDLERILKELNQRVYEIRGAIDFIKFTAGY